MDLTIVAAWVLPALTALGSLAYAFREKSRRAALEAELALEDERQETQLQTNLMGRLSQMEKRVDTQAEHMAAQASQIATLSAENSQLRNQVNELAADNVKLAGRVVELERERDEALKNAKQIKREYRVSLGLTPESDRPPAVSKK